MSSSSYQRRAEEAYHRDHFEHAARLAQAAVDLAPRNVEFRNTLAIMLTAALQFEKASFHVRKALKLDPENKQAQRMQNILFENLSLCAPEPNMQVDSKRQSTISIYQLH